MKKLKILCMTTAICSVFGMFSVGANAFTQGTWISKNNKWTYVDNTGKSATGWIQDNTNKWYYLDSEGYMVTGWVKVADNWYYLNTDGTMATGWLSYGGNWYYLNANGIMATNTDIDGYHLNEQGIWNNGTGQSAVPYTAPQSVAQTTPDNTVDNQSVIDNNKGTENTATENAEQNKPKIDFSTITEASVNLTK